MIYSSLPVTMIERNQPGALSQALELLGIDPRRPSSRLTPAEARVKMSLVRAYLTDEPTVCTNHNTGKSVVLYRLNTHTPHLQFLEARRKLDQVQQCSWEMLPYRFRISAGDVK